MRASCLTAIVAVAACSGCTDSVSAAGGPSQVVERRPFVAIGDSLTAGKGRDDDDAYPAVLKRMLASAGLPFSVNITVLLCGMEALPINGC